MEKFTRSANLNMSEIWCFSSPIVAVEAGEAATEKVRHRRAGESKRKQSPVTSRLFAYQAPRPPFTLSKFVKTSFFKFKIGDSAPFSQKAYHRGHGLAVKEKSSIAMSPV